MKTKMKLSELTYEFLESVGLTRVSMPTDCSDALLSVSNEATLEMAKSELSGRYGDVDIIVNTDAEWFDQIKIDDAKWQADFDRFCKRKAAWCSKNGAE